MKNHKSRLENILNKALAQPSLDYEMAIPDIVTIKDPCDCRRNVGSCWNRNPQPGQAPPPASKEGCDEAYEKNRKKCEDCADQGQQKYWCQRFAKDMHEVCKKAVDTCTEMERHCEDGQPGGAELICSCSVESCKFNDMDKVAGCNIRDRKTYEHVKRQIEGAASRQRFICNQLMEECLNPNKMGQDNPDIDVKG